MSRFKLFRKITQYISVPKFRKILEFFRHYFVGIYHRTDEHHIFLSGAGVAYSLFISIIPIILIVFSVLGNIIDTTTIEEQINYVISNLIPYPKYAEYMKEFLLSRVPEVVQYKTTAAYIGAFGLLFTSTWLFSSLRTILNRVFGVQEEKHALIGILRDFGMVILLLILIVLGTYIIPTINFLVSSAEHSEFLFFFRLSDFMDIILSVVSLLIMFAMFFVFYSLIPYDKLGKKVPFLAAFWATILWEIARSIFGYYVSHFLAMNKIYGAFIFIAVVAFWIFYSSCVFILAAEIGQLYRERILQKNMLLEEKQNGNGNSSKNSSGGNSSNGIDHK
ncbi:MAG: YihY/virulence factor BrkB family protein [Bacteroidetes bacterium]|nr:YihY/virulence factor BrkB family protein [Bacteroidota bacterium]MBU1678343.1 YihY/virulence factor BrkB family protein [Bacteroidota bacterium]MBU2507095.1 YihY/virulence factor BrkB family protein [Bacteroidota bacterium]